MWMSWTLYVLRYRLHYNRKQLYYIMLSSTSAEMSFELELYLLSFLLTTYLVSDSFYIEWWALMTFSNVLGNKGLNYLRGEAQIYFAESSS